MTPEEEWEVINTAGFDQAMFAKIKAVRTAMLNAQVEDVAGLITNVQGVYLKFDEEGNFLSIEAGRDNQRNPQVEMKIPSVWLEA
jgi:hypothetical protein